jgi:hypothetical protein
MQKIDILISTSSQNIGRLVFHVNFNDKNFSSEDLQDIADYCQVNNLFYIQPILGHLLDEHFIKENNYYCIDTSQYTNESPITSGQEYIELVLKNPIFCIIDELGTIIETFSYENEAQLRCDQIHDQGKIYDVKKIIY